MIICGMCAPYVPRSREATSRTEGGLVVIATWMFFFFFIAFMTRSPSVGVLVSSLYHFFVLSLIPSPIVIQCSPCSREEHKRMRRIYTEFQLLTHYAFHTKEIQTNNYSYPLPITLTLLHQPCCRFPYTPFFVSLSGTRVVRRLWADIFRSQGQ